MPLILPIEQWRNGEALVDPSGIAYDPNSPPALIGDDRMLGPAVSFGRENAYRIGVTVLCGMQGEAADLGPSDEFEISLNQSDIFGSNSFGLAIAEGTEGYRDRIERAIIGAAFVKPRLQPFNTMGMLDPETLGALLRIEAAVDIASDALAVMRSLPLNMVSTEMAHDTEEKALDVIAGGAHLTNHLNWAVVAGACAQARMLDEMPGVGEIQILLDEGPLGLDIVRKFGAIGINASAREQRRETWPDDVLGQVMDFGAAMSTGRIDAAY